MTLPALPSRCRPWSMAWRGSPLPTRWPATKQLRFGRKAGVPVESHQNAGFVWGKRGQMMDFSGELEVYLELWIIFTEKLWNMWKHEVWFHPHNWRSIWTYSWCRIAELVEMSWSIAVDFWVYAIDMSIVRRGKFNSTSCKLTDVENPPEM